MTATIIAFPDAYEREFIRTGTSLLTNTIDDDHALFGALMRDHFAASLAERLRFFVSNMSEFTRSRPEAVGDLVLLQGGPNIPLVNLPQLLNALYTSRRPKLTPV